MNRFNYCSAIKLSWKEVGTLIGEVVQKKLGREVKVRAHCDDSDYWSFGVFDTPFTVDEITLLLGMVEHDDEMLSDAIPAEGTASRSLGMYLSRKLLMKAMGVEWNEELITSTTLWLIDACKSEPIIRKNSIRIDQHHICLDDLKSKTELLQYFQENGPTHSTLMDFCEEYREQYGNELCWPYPISDGKHLGTFLLLVKEGVLSLPYDDADKIDYELFCVEDIVLFDADAMEVFIDDWNTFNEDLLKAMYAMKCYLRNKEEENEYKN